MVIQIARWPTLPAAWRDVQVSEARKILMWFRCWRSMQPKCPDSSRDLVMISLGAINRWDNQWFFIWWCYIDKEPYIDDIQASGGIVRTEDFETLWDSIYTNASEGLESGELYGCNDAMCMFWSVLIPEPQPKSRVHEEGKSLLNRETRSTSG